MNAPWFRSQNDGGRKHSYDLLKKQLKNFLLLCGVCLFVGYMTAMVAGNPDRIAKSGNFSRNILAEDRKFLNDFFQEVNQGDHRGGGIYTPISEKNGSAETMESSPDSAPRAVLVVNSEIVRRGELVVHSRTVKGKRQKLPLSCAVPRYSRAAAF